MKKTKKHNNTSSKDIYQVKVLAITDTGSIITSGYKDVFSYGIIFQHGILYNSTPLPIDLACAFASANIKLGTNIPIHVISLKEISERKVAISTIEIGGGNSDDEAIYNGMVIGQSYHLEVYDCNDEYITLRVPGTSLRGYIEAKAINNPEIGQEYDLILAKKGNSVFQFMAFEIEVSDYRETTIPSSQVDVEELYQKMFSQEASIISKEDETIIKKLLSDFPHTDKNNKLLADIPHIYCRCDPQAFINFEDFCHSYPKYMENHNFFITCDTNEESFTIFDSNYVVFKLFGDGEYLWLKEFYYNKKTIRAKIICDKNKYRKLIIEGFKIHILDSFNAIPHTFDWKKTMEYTDRMADFYYNILKRINSDYNKKRNTESKEFAIMRDLLFYEKDIERSKGGEIVRIKDSYPITHTVAMEYDPGVAYNFKLDSSDYSRLCGIMEPDEDLYVSLYDPTNSERPIRSGKVFYDDSTSIARIEFRKDTDKDLLRNGYLKKRTSTEHLDLQIDNINALFRVKENKFYRTIIPLEFLEPDIAPYQNLDFFDEKIRNAADGNNQPEAVRKALGNKQVLLIQGPPGTGKTTVIIEIIRQLVKEGKKVLVCSQTHAAVGNIKNKLSAFEKELSFISIENDGEEEAWGAGFDMEEYKSFLENNKNLIQGLINNESFDRNYIQKHYRYKTRNGSKYLSYHNYILDYFSASKDLYKNANSILSHLLSESEISGYLLDSYRYQIQDVILGTCIGIGMNIFVKEMHFDTVIIDEAAKANLAESLVPMRLGERFILVGDDKQLPPYMDRQMIADFVQDNNSKGSSSLSADTTLSEADVINTISKSLFELYHESMPQSSECVVMLNYQYRMHPEIGSFISDVFYDGKVNMGENTVKQFISLPSPYNEPIHFVNTESKPNPWEKRIGQSFINECEANLITDEILPLIKHAGLSKDVTLAIITPYCAQREHIRNKLMGTEFENSIYTIDSIQGMEFDIVIFSFVRSFSIKHERVVGFLDDMRRLNVSLSRAKKKLILIGNKPTLTRPEAHRGSDNRVINPVDVFEKLSQTYIQYDNPSKARKFHDKYKLGDTLLCSIEKIEGTYLYFKVKDNPEFEFRRPIKESHILYQIKDAEEIMMEINEFSNSLQPYFSVISYLFNGQMYDIVDFNTVTSELKCGSMISCTITKKGRVIMASYKGFSCMIPEGAFNYEFRDNVSTGDTIKARVFMIDEEKQIIHIFPVLTSYEDSIRNREVTKFFFTVDEKNYPNELSLLFDNGEQAYFSISNKFYWTSLLEGDLYCDFQGDYNDEDYITYNMWRISAFRKKHKKGDVVKARVSYVGNFCIAWSEGIAAKIENFREKKITKGSEYDVEVIYDENERIAFSIV